MREGGREGDCPWKHLAVLTCALRHGALTQLTGSRRAVSFWATFS